MTKGFTDKSGKFRPTENKKGVRMKRDKSISPQGIPLTKTRMRRDPDIIKIPVLEESRKKMDELLKESKFNDNESDRDSYKEGFDRGIAFAEVAFDNIDKIKIGTDITKLDFGADEYELGFKILENRDDVEEFVRHSVFTSEENDRDFSPFEITAKELNERMFDDKGEQISDAFDAFENGLGDAVNWYVSFVFEKNKELGT